MEIVCPLLTRKVVCCQLLVTVTLNETSCEVTMAGSISNKAQKRRTRATPTTSLPMQPSFCGLKGTGLLGVHWKRLPANCSWGSQQKSASRCALWHTHIVTWVSGIHTDCCVLSLLSKTH